MADGQDLAERQETAGPRAAPEQQLKRKITKDPGNISLYLELADLYRRDERFEEAESVLQRALIASADSMELGLRLFRVKDFPMAIRAFQKARGDLKLKGLVLFYLGASFESIEQYELALNNYELTIEEIGERDQDVLKQALYRAGVVAMDRVKDWEKAKST